MDAFGYLNEEVIRWKKEVWEHKYLILLSLGLIIIALIVDYTAGYYTTYKAQVDDVPDLILKYVPPINLNFLFVYGWLIVLFIFVAYPLFFDAKKIHVVIFQSSFVIIVRSFFIILTHLQTPLTAVGGNFPKILSILKFYNDQFFSGHVALPFLAFLIFRENKLLKYFFLISSIVMGIVVLVMHQHYSIDVFAAYFIVYGCYKIGEGVMKRLKI